MENYFVELNNINVNDKTEAKNNLTYLSWAFAWGELKKKHPMATYTIYEDEHGRPYFTDGRTCWVKTGVTVPVGEEKIEHIEYLPIMNYRNEAIPADKVTSTDMNKTIQRSLTKAVARHGLGLYIYAGEDLPEAEKEDQKKEMQKTITDKEAMILSNTLTPEQIEWVRDTYHVKKLAELTAEQYGALMQTLNKRAKNGK